MVEIGTMLVVAIRPQWGRQMLREEGRRERGMGSASYKGGWFRWEGSVGRRTGGEKRNITNVEKEGRAMGKLLVRL